MYSDSNARQRSNACQADAAVASQAQFATSAELAMPRFQMEMIMDFTHLPGDTSWPYPPPKGPGALENGTGGYVSNRWADWTVLPAINVVNDALNTGDLIPGRRYLDAIVKYHLYQGMINGTGTRGAGLIVDNSCARPADCLSCLIDTSGGSDDGFVQSHANAVVQAWVYHGMTQVGKLARWIGDTSVAAMLDSRRAALKAAFNRQFVSASGAVCDGLCAEVNHTSIHASFYALAFGLIDTDHQGGTFEYIKQRIASSSVGFPGGAYPIGFLLTALYNVESDRGHAAYEVLTSAKKHSWVAMMRDHAATTTMECWSPDELPNLSFSHIWSASPAFVIPWLLAGVQPLTPGWRTMEIKPQPGPLETMSLTMPTVRGPVGVNVTQRFEPSSATVLASFQLAVRIPGNVHAVLVVPRKLHSLTANARCVVVDGRIQKGTIVDAAGEHVSIVVTAGAHTVTWCP